jgi:DNA-binding NarL/FixJ family response regulator
MTIVYIVEQSAFARRGLEELLRGPGIEINSNAANIAELDERYRFDDLPPGVIVTSAVPRQLAVMLEQAAASDLFHDVPIVVIPDTASLAYDPATSLRIGARSVLSSELSRAQIVAALQAISLGFAVSGPVVGPVPSVLPPPAESAEIAEPLTARELDVLRLLALGLANKQIAARLRISDHTVKFHVAAILGKLGAASRTEAVAVGIRTGLVLL